LFQLLKYNLPALLWATVILFLTLLPNASLPEVPAWELISFATASHAVVFFILALLLRFGLNKQSAFANLRRHSGWFTLLISLFFGITIEILQSQMGLGRQGDVMDVVSNSIGTLAGVAFYPIIIRRLLPNFL
jgi:glycopeptide antibiotics resistance protein